MQGLKVVFVINRLKLGGAQRVVITLAQAMRDLGHDTHIVCFQHSEELVGAEELPVHYFKRGLSFLPPPLRNRLLARKLDRYILEKIGTPNLVLSNMSKANRILMHSALPNIHIVVHNTLSMLGEIRQMSPLARWLRTTKMRAIYLKRPCICCSDGVYQDFIKLMPGHTQVQRILNPADTKHVRAWSEAYTTPYENYVVHVGSFIPQKRHDILLEAYRDSRIEESLVLVGSGELEADIKQQAVRLGIENKVIFAGFHSNPYPIMRGAKLKILSSDYEGLALVLLESLVLGIPTVSTDCDSGPREILPQTNLVPVGDVAAMAAAIRRAIADPDAFRCELPQQFDAERVAAQYLALAAGTAH